MDWKTILIVGLGILSIVVLYYCYKRYYNEEGFQGQNSIVSSETFIGSSASTYKYMFSGSIIQLREMYSEIIRFITDYRNYSGYANATIYPYYYSSKYQKNLQIVDFSYRIRDNLYWFPYTGQYGTSPNWLINFQSETTGRIDLDIYNSNLNRYKSFIKTYSASNKQEYLFNRSLVKPSLLYRSIDLSEPPSFFNLTNSSGVLLDTNITEVTAFTANNQSWYTNFISYAIANKNLYPPSDVLRDTSYRVLYSGDPTADKPPNLTYSDVNSGKKAGQIVTKLPDRRYTLQTARSEQLELNVYGGSLTSNQISNFQDCMFLGSVFTNFDDQYNLDTILRVPYNDIINGKNCYYSFNMFLPELTVSATEVNSIRKFTYTADESPTGSITYNTNLVNLRSNDTIKILSDDELDVNNQTFISNVNGGFQAKPFTLITSSNQAYVGKITPTMLAKIPNLARRYITSWTYNRSRRLLEQHMNDLKSSGLHSNELAKAHYIYLAMTNYSGSNLDTLLTTYADYDSYTSNSGTFTIDATLSNVPNEDIAKRIVASSRIYNSYKYTNRILELSRTSVGGMTFNAGIKTNYFRNADPTLSITGDIISSLIVALDNIGRAVITFPKDGITSAYDSIYSSLTAGPLKTLLYSTKISVENVYNIMNNISEISLQISDYFNRSIIDSSQLINNNYINDSMTLISELKSMVNTSTIPAELTIINISGSGTTNTIRVNSVSGYSINDYIVISGTTNFEGGSEAYKIISIDTSTNTIIISRSKPGALETPSSGRIKIYSLKRYLEETKNNVNSLKSNSYFSSTNEIIVRAKKNIELNELFIISFNTNLETIIKSIKSIYQLIDTAQMISKLIQNISLIDAWSGGSVRYEINSYVKQGGIKYKSIKVNTSIPVTDTTHWLPLNDENIKSYIDTTISDISGSITDFTNFISNLDSIRTNALNDDTRYRNLLGRRNNPRATTAERNEKQTEIDIYLANLYGTKTQPYTNAVSIISNFTTFKTSIESLKTIIQNLRTSIGPGGVAGAMGAPSGLELNTLKNDFNYLMYNNKLLPDYGNLSNLNISDSSFLNSIAQLYYESSDGLYEMTTIYDVYMIGSNSVDIRFDKKQRLPKGRINNLNIQYLPQIQEYNRLLDIIEDGSWSNYDRYKDTKYTTSKGEIFTKYGIDTYYEDLSAATNKLQPIFNPIYPIDQNINVKDLQIELSNLNTSNTLIKDILAGKIRGSNIPNIPETQETVGYNYTDRLKTIQYSIDEKIYKIETQISGVLQNCARVFVTPSRTSTGVWKFPINGMAIGINAALTYNLAYNGNLEVDMGNTQGNIGQYYPIIEYTKNNTPPIVCGDINFINKAAALFNQTAFLNLSSFTCKITGDDLAERLKPRSASERTAEDSAISSRSNNFYDSNDGPLYVDKILGFEQVNENTCRYKWQETQYDLLTNGPFVSDDGIIKQRTVNVQYQFKYDNLEYQNPKLFPDNTRNNNPNEGFKYLENTNVLFGDLYLSLYSWYAAATRNLTNYLYDLNSKYTTLYTPQYDTLVTKYNLQSSNLSTLNHSTIALFSTNFLIAKDLNLMFRDVTVIDSFDDIIDKQIVGKCDSIITNPPKFTNNYNSITYNYRPGNDKGLTTVNNEKQIQARVLEIDRRPYYNEYGDFLSGLYDNEVERIRRDRTSSGTYNKYRTVDIKDFFTDIFNKVYRHNISRCDNPTIDPENCFTIEDDGCKYQFNGDINSELYTRVTTNIAARNDILQQISNTNTALSNTTDEIRDIYDLKLVTLDNRNVIERAGRINEEIYPELSNIYNELTALTNDRNTTQASINTINTTYSNLLETQTSDRNLPTYMANQVIPIIKPLPDEASSLDTQYGECREYLCTSPVVMNSLVEQYNLDTDYTDTIISILKGATASPFQCDYLVDVRKKNAIVTNPNLQYNRIRFTPLRVSYSDNKAAIYLPGNTFIELSNTCINLNSDNFTIDWFQYGVFDSENLDPFVFSYGSKSLALQFITKRTDSSIIHFILYINSIEFLRVDLNYNQLNRWTYFAIVRYNNVITCYKDGFAFISKEFLQPITNSSTVYLGSDGSTIPINCFKGAIRFFSFNNYDALYMNDLFNKVPTNPIKNINTRFIIRENSGDNTIINIVKRNIQRTNIIPNSVSYGQITSGNQTFIRNGTVLTELNRGNFNRNSIIINIDKIYISDRENHIIKELNNDTKTYRTIVGTGVAGRGVNDTPVLQAALEYPSGLCFGDKLYIADSGNNRICSVSSDRLYEFIINIPNVSYIAFNNLYVYYINSSTKRIGRRKVVDSFDFEPNYILLPDTSTACGIGFDTSNNIYIIDSQNKCIYKVLLSSGSTTINTIITGLDNPVSITLDSVGNVYIAEKNSKNILMSSYISPLSYSIPLRIAGNNSTYSLYNEGYARLVDLIPESIFYHISTNKLYVVDSRKLCYIEKASIPNTPSDKTYQFNNTSSSSSLKIGSEGESDYKFNKNLFTIQWFMFMEGSGLQTIFTFESLSAIELGITFDIASTTKMNLYINGRIYPYNLQTNAPTPIEFNRSEIVGLWVHMAIVHNGSTLSIYKNSILVYSLDSRSFSFNSTNSQLTIGNRLSPAIETGFRGQIRSFMIYNKLARNYNKIIETYTNSSLLCTPNLVLHLANGVDTNEYNDYSITNTNITTNRAQTTNSYPYSSSYNPFKIKLNYANGSNYEPVYGIQAYGRPFVTDLAGLKSITSFNIFTISYEKSVQQWLLEGSPDGGSNWYTLHEQYTPYSSRSSPIYPAFNSYSLNFDTVAQRNVGGDIVRMTKSFQLARMIEDCSFVITSNISDTGEYTKGVTSSNGFFIQDNTPYIEDVSGFQFVKNLLGDYNSNIQNLYDPIISDSSNILTRMSNAYDQSRSDTYMAVGKLTTLNFYSNNFNNYDTLRTYMINNARFRNTIFDSYSDSSSYMSNIIRFSIIDSETIDIVFDKVDLTDFTLATLPAVLPANYPTSRIRTGGARYTLSVTPGFLDLTAAFVSDITPFILEDEDDFRPRLTNPRAINYKDRFNLREKLLVGIRNPTAPVAQFTFPATFTFSNVESLTGLTGITASNVFTAATNTIEYTVSNEGGTLPIDKTNYIVQFRSLTEVNSVTSATIDNTRFKISISVANITTLISNFKTYFNGLYISNSVNGYPYTSVMKKVYGYRIASNILYVSCGIEYSVGSQIYYNITPNISQFGTQLYYKVVFKTGNDVLAFEPCTVATAGTLTTNTDNTPLLIAGTTDNEIKNNYIKNILWKQIKFKPTSATSRLSYSISQIQFFNSALNNNTRPLFVESLTVEGGMVEDFDFTKLIDGVNTQIRNIDNIKEDRYFSHDYIGGELTATFREGTSVDGFSFMTAYSLNNPEKWTVEATTDGTSWIEVARQDTSYNYLTNSTGKESFYRTPIFSFISNTPTTLVQARINTSDETETTTYRYLRFFAISPSLNFQLINIELYNGNVKQTVSPALSTYNYLFNNTNLTQTTITTVSTYEAPTNNIDNLTNVSLSIEFTTPISFNGISFITGIDVNKCITMWRIEASPDGTSWNLIHTQEYPYRNLSIDYPHFFCRTPIFYKNGNIVDRAQPSYYDTKTWPVKHIRFRPKFVPGNNRGEVFEISHFDFFKDSDLAIGSSIVSSTNNDLLTFKNVLTSVVTDLKIFRGIYGTNFIEFNFNNPIYFNGFSFMSGSQINTCVQLWDLEVSIDNVFWVIFHSTKNIIYTRNFYPSPYYRIPVIYFQGDTRIENYTNIANKYYIVSGADPTSLTNNGTLFEINLLLTMLMIGPTNIIRRVRFTTRDNNDTFNGIINKSSIYNIQDNGYSWIEFLNNSRIINTPVNVYYKNEYPNTYGGSAVMSKTLFEMKGTMLSGSTRLDLLLRLLLDTTPNPNLIPAIYGNTNRGTNTITSFRLYTNRRSNSGTLLFDTNSSYYLQQHRFWTKPSIYQGFTNYESIEIDYIDRFILETNKPFNKELFRLIGSNNKVISKKSYRVEYSNKVIIIYLNTYVEIIGYTITTGLYSHLSDANSWKVFGMKNKQWILLDKQDKYDIPVERSYTLPPFYFNSKKIVKNDSMPHMKIIEDYYKKKINPFGKAVFKKYMYDNNKTYYMVFDEYDNNRNLLDTDLIIGFVIVKGVVKKPVMYENPDGSFDAFNLKKKEMMAFWKKKIGLNLETKYLSDY